ncbi:MAG: ribosome-associated heat shock protein Hsp15 [Psychromonas sp.]
MRIDKYIWCVRLAKTRSIASELVSKGKVRLNSKDIKPSREVKEGDIIEIINHSAVFSYQVIGIINRRIGAPLVKDFIVDKTPNEEIEKLKEYRAAQNNYRHHGTGKPTKRDRRDMDDFLENWE